MRIAQLAPLAESVPPKAYGGTELVVSLLTEELVKMGHQVTLFASGDSVSQSTLVSGSPSGLRKHEPRGQRWAAYEIEQLFRLRERAFQFDIIHNHMGYVSLPFLADLVGARGFGNASEASIVTTLHNPIKDYCADIYLKYGYLNFVAISESFRKLNYPEELNYVGTIYNGIDCSLYNSCGNELELKGAGFEPGIGTELDLGIGTEFDLGIGTEFDLGRDLESVGAFEQACNESANKRNKFDNGYLLFLGRICGDKGAYEAIEFASAVGMPLKMAGKVDSADQSYFDELIGPVLTGQRRVSCPVDYVGEIDEAKKIELLAGAKAVIYPVKFEEPFGLVIAESMAAGVPVIAMRRGAIPELIIDGVTGIVADSLEEMVRCFREQFSLLDSAAARLQCRQRVEERFSSRAMALNYLALYERLRKVPASTGV
ncbi:MAG: glycosyltransferase family 4 protein [Candidatus Obscuribacter phosphatis]|uniref:Glycosyltransferase family 4 protein n=1 Tax=Candidatus Obscuribacter phosphatis TaxID=1906157 RepID=A0A8J7TMQ1_9BACT|nr:glycosyltransferase family 4 protein [Candidatus Obscuribacter phosphatis]